MQNSFFRHNCRLVRFLFAYTLSPFRNPNWESSAKGWVFSKIFFELVYRRSVILFRGSFCHFFSFRLRLIEFFEKKLPSDDISYYTTLMLLLLLGFRAIYAAVFGLIVPSKNQKKLEAYARRRMGFAVQKARWSRYYRPLPKSGRTGEREDG